MYYDTYGNPHETFPGELSMPGRNNRQQPGPAAQNARQGDAFPRKMFEIIFVDTPDDIDKFKINPGFDQIFAGKDNSFFAVKSAMGNGYTTDFYPLEKPAHSNAAATASVSAPTSAAQPFDMSAYVTKAELPQMVYSVIAEMSTPHPKEEARNGSV